MMRHLRPLPFIRFKKISTLSVFLLTATTTGCLKTRSQLRQENSPSEAATPSEEDHSAEAGRPATQGSYQWEEVRSELIRLNGKVEELENHQKTQSVTSLQEHLAKLDARLAEIEKNQATLSADLKGMKEAKPALDEGRGGTRANLAQKSKELLERGFGLINQKSFEEAKASFQSLLDAGVKGKEAAEAQFGLGLSQFHLKEYREAILSLNKVQELFPKSPRLPESLLTIGRSFEKLNLKKEALGFYAELKEKFPKSKEAKKIPGRDPSSHRKSR